MGLLDTFRRPKPGGPKRCVRVLKGRCQNAGCGAGTRRLKTSMRWWPRVGQSLLARSRELVVTNGYAANACEAFASNMVGDGIKPSSLIEDAALRDRGPAALAGLDR